MEEEEEVLGVHGVHATGARAIFSGYRTIQGESAVVAGAEIIVGVLSVIDGTSEMGAFQIVCSDFLSLAG